MAAPRLYIGGACIHAYEMNVETGAITVAAPPMSDGQCSGSFMVPSKDGSKLYTTASPGAAAFAIDANSGALAHINTVATEIAGNSHIELDGAELAVVLSAYGGGGVNVLQLQADGSLAGGSSVQHVGGSMGDPARQDKPHPHSSFVDPGGGRLLVSDLGTDKIHTYTMADGALSESSVYSSAAGAGPRHVCFHPNGRWVYSINEMDCTMTLLQYDGAAGALGPCLQSISTLPEGYDNKGEHALNKNAAGGPASGPNSPGQTNATADVHVTPDGRFVLGSNRGHDSLVCFAIDSKDGAMSLVGFTSTGGEHPRNFGIHPTGRWVVVANQNTNNVVIFSFDPATGAMVPTGQQLTEVTKPRCVKWSSPAVATSEEGEPLVSAAVAAATAPLLAKIAELEAAAAGKSTEGLVTLADLIGELPDVHCTKGSIEVRGLTLTYWRYAKTDADKPPGESLSSCPARAGCAPLITRGAGPRVSQLQSLAR